MTRTPDEQAPGGGPEQQPGDPARPVTISYIAETAGVSVPTVSKVINGRRGVAPDTRARVEELINRYGYRRPPPSTRNNIMELVFRELESMWGLEVIRGVERAARQHNVGVLLSGFGPEPGRVRSWVTETLTRRPACVISVAQLSAAERNQLRAKGIPFVVFDPTVELPEDVPFVGATNWSGGRTATRHLIELGHRRIAMISGPEHVLFCRARLDGYRAAMEAAEVPADPRLVVRTNLTREDGYAAARDLLSRADRPTAIFAANDLQALGVYQAAREVGLGIPGDLSVVGFDDLPVVSWVDPPMTTVHQPLTEMAATATELALALGRGERISYPGDRAGHHTHGTQEHRPSALSRSDRLRWTVPRPGTAAAPGGPARLEHVIHALVAPLQRVAVQELASVPYHRGEVADPGVVADGFEELQELAG